MKTELVNIAWFCGATGIPRTKRIPALIVGPLAVHHDLYEDAHLWVVTHIRTGYAVRRRIKSRARAIRVAKALQFLDWNFRSPKSRKVKAMAEKVQWAISVTT
jgi:hypothetical protein